MESDATTDIAFVKMHGLGNDYVYICLPTLLRQIRRTSPNALRIGTVASAVTG
jgi:diaminopimelate epimerase